jgi:hypothetical protein
MALFSKKFSDITGFVLWSDSSVENRRARLVLSYRDSNPRFTVYTGAAGKEGVISWPCDLPHFVTILNMLKDIANGPNGDKKVIDSLTTKYENDKPTNEKVLMSKLVIGKNNEGVCYMALIDENKPKIAFEIKPSQYHIFRDSNGEMIPISAVSRLMTIGIADSLLTLVSVTMLEHTKETYENVTNRSEIKPRGKGGKDNSSNTKEQFEDLVY